MSCQEYPTLASSGSAGCLSRVKRDLFNTQREEGKVEQEGKMKKGKGEREKFLSD